MNAGVALLEPGVTHSHFGTISMDEIGPWIKADSSADLCYCNNLLVLGIVQGRARNNNLPTNVSLCEWVRVSVFLSCVTNGSFSVNIFALIWRVKLSMASALNIGP